MVMMTQYGQQGVTGQENLRRNLGQARASPLSGPGAGQLEITIEYVSPSS
jgi:hypothetical protein